MSGVVVVYPSLSSFVATDLEILGKHFRVLPYEYRVERGAGRRFLTFLASHRRKYRSIVAWFGDVYANLAVRAAGPLRKRVVVIAGGYDTTYIPSIGYGLLATERKRRLARYAFRGADRVLVVDGSLKDELVATLRLDGSNIEVLHTGYDTRFFRPRGPKNPRLVLTVGAIDGINVKRKGLDTFVRSARHLPDHTFRVIGAWRDDTVDRLRAIAPGNVTLTGEVPRESLLTSFQEAAVYAQLSMFEGLPNALAEAMLCECVPVGTRVCGIPTLMGDLGFYVPVGDEGATARAIEQASRSDLGPQARDRIAREFPIEKREKALHDLIIEIETS